MKRLLLLISVLFIFGCTFQIQTTDDVYYSPSRYRDSNQPVVQEYNDDQYLRMKVSNYSRWSLIDDYSYWYDSRYSFNFYRYGMNWGWNPYFNYFSWNPYNYFYYPIYRENPRYTIINHRRDIGSVSTSNLSSYRNRNYNNTNFANPSLNFNSNLYKKVTPINPNTPTYERPIRTFTPPSTSPSTSSPSPGGNSGGFKSNGSSSNKPRIGKN